ncbi:helix-turn-helix domain-containing protein [Streptomyces olivoreticuli]|uniref:helix-turn-helix domain-containing protein n=1 Tax=Streptomyces olivoreticuli TaxID=68246 RepID=UPI000E241DF4|nr:helix-turn-helix transcriptional regulator [Streptomyces olivoreticuli]
MHWNLRLVAAKKGIWKATDLQRSLAEYGLVISSAKMSGLWSGQPLSLKLKDLDVICVVLDCEIGDLLIPEPEMVSWSVPDERSRWPNACPPVIPRPRGHDSLPPE